MADELDNEGLNPQGEPSTPVSEPNNPEPQVPLARLREEADKRKALEEELKVLKQSSVPVDEQEQKIRATVEKIAQEKTEQEKQEEIQLRKELEEVHTIYGDFDEKKLLKIIERYGCYNEDKEVNWDAAMELYNKIGEVPAESPKPKVPLGKRAGNAAQPEVETEVDVSKFSMHELVNLAKKKLGLE